MTKLEKAIEKFLEGVHNIDPDAEVATEQNYYRGQVKEIPSGRRLDYTGKVAQDLKIQVRSTKFRTTCTYVVWENRGGTIEGSQHGVLNI